MAHGAGFAPDTVFELNPLFLFRWEETQHAYVLLYPEGLVKLNDTAGEILSMVAETATMREIVDRLADKYGDQAIAPDILKFLEISRAKNWIRVKN